MRTEEKTMDEASSSTPHPEGSKWRILERNSSKISDSLYKFYEPEEARTASLDIYFFHDLELEGESDRDLYISTWRTATELEEVWPQTWLPKTFPRARIISISYDASTEETDTKGRIRLHLIGENLLWEIMSARKDCGNVRPVILVGHGFGGIVIKQLCIQARDKRREYVAGSDVNMFLDSIKGIFFYSTPHHGVEGIESMAAKEGPLLRWMYAFNAESAQLHEAFRQLWREKDFQWIIFALGGTEWTSTGGGCRFRVREASTRFCDKYMTSASDHFAICRPSDRKDNKYQHLENLIQEVESRIQLERRILQRVPKVTVGVEIFMAQVLEKHLQGHRFLGFCGMGGIGKTTMAKLVFNKLCPNFEFTCFVDDIKLISGEREEVKEKVWKRMRRHGVIPSASIYTDVWNQVIGRSLLVVFDDIADTDHAELLGEIADDNEMADSRFILTTRDTQVLSHLASCGYDVHISHLDTLADEDAEKLLTTYAFPEQGKPPDSLRNIVKQVISGCEGLPLTLEVLGKHLKGKGKDIWAEIPRALKVCDNIGNLEKRVWAKLQLSYDALTDEEKSMFLDVASFFIYVDCFSVEEAIMAWSSTYGSVQHRLLVLEEKSLVHITEVPSNLGQVDEFVGRTSLRLFYMHEHIRRMGERIARKSGRSCDWSTLLSSRSSLDPDLHHDWHPFRHPRHDRIIFQRRMQLENIVVLKMEITGEQAQLRDHSCVMCMMQDVLHRLTKLQYMDLEISTYRSCDGCRGRSVTLPSTLVMLRLAGDVKNMVLPPEAGEKLTVLKFEYAYVMQRFRIQEALSTNTCAYLTNLERLDLARCSLGGLTSRSLRRLEHLRLLSITQCSELGDLLEALGNFRSLQQLTLSSIQEPLELPDTFGTLTGLECLNVGTCQVRKLPVTFTKLTRLQFLRLDRIVGEPNVMGQLPHLRALVMDCPAIDDFGDSVRHLTSLERLKLKCPGMVELPDSFGNLTNLESLELVCPIRSLPATFSDFTRLKELKMDVSGRLGAMDDLGGSNRNLCSLERLFLAGEGAGELAVKLGCFDTLRELTIENCPSLPALPVTLGNFIRLEKLEIVDAGVRFLPYSLGELSELQLLNLCNLKNLESLPESLGHLQSLEILTIEECPLQSLPESMGQLSRLKQLSLDGCWNLETLPETIEALSTLKKLVYGDSSPMMRELERLLARARGDNPKLLERNGSLHFLERSLRNLSQLEHLDISGVGVSSLPDSLGQLPQLRVLTLRNLKNLESLPETLGHLQSLESLTIDECPLQSLPESMGQLSSLKHLSLNMCGNLETLPETIGTMSSLEKLSLRHCSSLRCLPRSLVNLPQLSLDITRCQSLPEQGSSDLPPNLRHQTLVKPLIDLLESYFL